MKLTKEQKRKKCQKQEQKRKHLKKEQLIDYLQIIRNPPEQVANVAFFSMVVNNKRIFSELNIVKQDKEKGTVTMNLSGETKQLINELSKQTA